MHSFTTRPAEDWSITVSSYKKGTVIEATERIETFLNSQTYADRTADGVGGDTVKTAYESISGETSARFGITIESSASATGGENFTPATYSTTFLKVTYSNSTKAGSQSTESATVTRNYTHQYVKDENGTSVTERVSADTSFSSRKGESASSQEVGNSGAVNWNEKSPEPTVTNNFDSPVTLNTGKSTSSHTFYSKSQAYQKDFTTTFSNGVASVYTTSSYTVFATDSLMPTSSWMLGPSYINDQVTTGISSDGEKTNAVTYNGVFRETYTSLSGTSVVVERTWPYTVYNFEGLQDTVVLMNVNRGTDFNLGGILWVFSLRNLDATASTTGRFTNLFSSVSGDDIVIKEYSKFLSASSAVTAINLSIATAQMDASLAADNLTFKGTKTSYDGIYYPSSTTSSLYVVGTGDGTGTATSTRKSIVNPDFNTTDIRTFNIPGVNASQSTFYTESDHTAPASSVTIYTHTVQQSSYRQSDSSWMTKTVSSHWLSSLESSFRRDKRHKSATQTHLVKYRGTTADEILISKCYTTDTTGTQPLIIYLGMQKTTSVRIITLERTETISTYLLDLHSYVSNYSFTDRKGYSETTPSTVSGGGGNSAPAGTGGSGMGSGGTAVPDVGTAKGGTTQSLSGVVNVTRYSEQRLGPLIQRRPRNFNNAQVNRAVFPVLPEGWAGFGGTFDPKALQVYKTTTQGIAAGANFAEWQTIDMYAGECLAAEGVSMCAAISWPAGFGGQSFKVISPPAGLESIMSVAATWVSVTQLASDTTTTFTSRFATHTLKLEGQIAGDFWSAHYLQADNSYRDQLNYDQGFEGLVGFGLGQNILEQSYQVILDAGYVEWTEYHSTQSVGVGNYNKTGEDGTVSFSVPWDHAIVYRAEHVFTARWAAGNYTNHFFSLPYLNTD